MNRQIDSVTHVRTIARRRAIGAEIIAGYERVPETAEELAAAEANARAMIADEPW